MQFGTLSLLMHREEHETLPSKADECQVA